MALGFLPSTSLTNPGALEFYGNPGVTTVDIGTLETDRYGLSTCKSVYTTNVNNYSANPTALPNVYSYHPIWTFLQCEHQSETVKNGFVTATCEYAGLNPNITLTPIYELVIGLSSEPITTHPNFVSKIGGTAIAPLNGAIFEHYSNDGSVDSIAPPATPANNSNWLFKTFALFNGDGSQNTFAGIEDYLAATEVTWRGSTTVAVTNLPGLGTAGQIAIPQGPIPAVPTGYTFFNWLDLGYNGTQRGAAFSLSHEWKLSGSRGWNTIIYGSP